MHAVDRAKLHIVTHITTTSHKEWQMLAVIPIWL